MDGNQRVNCEKFSEKVEHSAKMMRQKDGKGRRAKRQLESERKSTFTEINNSS